MSNGKVPGNRREFLRGGAGIGIAAAAGLGMTQQAWAEINPANVTNGDVAILQFLAAAELVEDDLWQQYSEIAVSNAEYNRALRRIDRSLVRYIQDDRDDERSHAALINAFLTRIGATPVNLDPFRTLPSLPVVGAAQVGRLTNLRKLNVDTAWFNRYRGTGNPDLGGNFGQFVSLNSVPTVPTMNGMSEQSVQAAAHSAAFHFCAIEQGGASLYNGLLSKVTSLDALAIVAAIGPTEFYHFAAFHKSLENLPALTANGLQFPDLRNNRDLGEAIFPEPCQFLDATLPLCSVVRPRSNANSGPLAAAVGLVESGLFSGQSDAFFNAVVALADAADKATRGQI